MTHKLEKVTAFVVHRSAGGARLLLLKHPWAGIQLPAGTVEVGEAPEAAVLREAWEETALEGLRLHRYLGEMIEWPPDDYRVVVQSSDVFSRPDRASFTWAHFGRGLWVRLERKEASFSQVTYEEFDQLPDPNFITYCITGWVPNEALVENQRRYFFELAYDGPLAEGWDVEVDDHRFHLFWAPLEALPALIAPQDGWLRMLPELRRD